MARITVEDCLNRVHNRFALIHMAAKRVRQLRKGAEPLVQCKNKDIVVSLREIAAAKIYETKGRGRKSRAQEEAESLLRDRSLDSSSLPESYKEDDEGRTLPQEHP